MGTTYSSIISKYRKKTHKTQPRDVIINRRDLNSAWYPPNVIRNQKYSIITFIPLCLFEQFSVFLNFYFLIIGLTQFIPTFRVGYFSTYWAPLGFVVFVSMVREAYEDIKRAYRDKEINSQKYTLITEDGPKELLSSEINVSDVIVIHKNQRVPADILLLQTSDKSGTCFIRTDQLDGETDWKLRIATSDTQYLEDISVLSSDRTQTAKINAEKPSLNIHEFNGVMHWKNDTPLSVENMLWSGTVIATSEVVGCVVYTGADTRIVMNTRQPRYKFGLMDEQINTLTKLLFVGSFVLSFFLVILKGFDRFWYRYFVRFLLLFSYMIPISLRVNLDLGKLVYSWFIEKDDNIPGSIVRTSTIPEELGRVGYLLADKTGTLTQNVMIFKRLKLETVSYTIENKNQIVSLLEQEYATNAPVDFVSQASLSTSSTLPFDKNYKTTTSAEAKTVTEVIKALALCHNVTPIANDSVQSDVSHTTSNTPKTSFSSLNTIFGTNELELSPIIAVAYQASSPDEIAIVEWTEQVGLTLIRRSLKSMTLKLNSTEQLYDYEILQLFPFTADTKRMGIIVRDEQTKDIIFYLKGADTVMQNIVQYNDWLQEESSNMAREGLRTLVIAKKHLTQEQYQEFEQNLSRARLQTINRSRYVNEVIETLECNMELLGITGVEDRLQENVRQALESLHNAGIKIWMLTGDKLETAICIAKSSKLIGRKDDIYVIKQVATRDECLQEINVFKRRTGACLVITGDALQICLSFYEKDLMNLIIESPSVVVCRCSPTQKAAVTDILKKYGNKKVRVCAIGDGGNDVSMIQSAHVGIGIIGREGRQASLAADFSIHQFSYLCHLLFVHGRNSYKRTASLSQFIIHRGLLFCVMQAIFSSVFYFSTTSLFPGYLLVGYVTFFTMFPVFLLVLDKDIPSEIALLYPELYKELSKGRSLSYKTFVLWVFVSVYQGSAIMYLSLFLFDDDFIHIVSITFTALILTELLMVALTVRTWHPLMIIGELLSLGCYLIALFVFQSHFNIAFIESWSFMWRVVVITIISCLPLYILKYMQITFKPPIHEKLAQYGTLK